jgi:two-component system, cell cycle sensor histidine kinase and response regulator CckA
VSARQVLEAQLRQAQKMEAVGQLAGGVAHDFNNLLTAVLASGDLLRSALPADSPLAEDADAISRAARRGAELTQKLLAFSRRQPLELRTLSLGAVAEAFTRMARRVVPEDVEVALQVEAAEATIRADQGAVEQILMNLVTNARDAMPTGGKLRIEIGRRTLDQEHREAYGWGEPGEYVTLVVSDTGVGMDAETQRHIFEPFFTSKPTGQGTGLGMSTVYGLVKQQQGFVHVYSEVGHGTTVRVYFPAIHGEVAEIAEPAVPDIHGGTETILLVEDNEAVRRAATRVLERFGYHVLTATDGSKALEIMTSGVPAPDLIISDVVMPGISGPQFLAQLREAGPVPKFLFTSGYTERDVHERTRLEPSMPFLAKPWTVSELLRKVRGVLDGPPAGP